MAKISVPTTLQFFQCHRNFGKVTEEGKVEVPEIDFGVYVFIDLFFGYGNDLAFENKGGHKQYKKYDSQGDAGDLGDFFEHR